MERALTPEAAAAICRHMNDDHADAIAGYARTFGGVDDVSAAEMLSLDAAAMELGVERPSGKVVCRIVFDHPLTDSADARDTLIAMAKQSASNV